MSDKRMNISEIAKLANVSKSTVSRVLNNKSNVQPKTKEKVQRVMIENDYYPSVFARNIMNQKSNTIGLLIFSDTDAVFPNPFYDEVLKGIACETNKRGYYMLFCYEKFNDYISAIKEKRIDGIITIGPHTKNTEALAKIKKTGIPLVSTSTIGKKTNVMYVDVDCYLGARLAVEHLIRLGHRKIALIIGGPEDSNSNIARKQGYIDVLKENGIPFDSKKVRSGNTSISSGNVAMDSLLNTENITAVFVTSDPMAMGVISSINEHGLKIPEDISIVGFDDIPLAAALNPPLTTVRQFMYEKGIKATQILIKFIEGKSTESHYTFIPELIIRNSTRRID